MSGLCGRLLPITDLTEYVRSTAYNGHCPDVVRSSNHRQINSKFLVGESMPKINLDEEVTVPEIEEAISHLRKTATNTHNLKIAAWCEQEIDAMLDLILAKK